MTVDSVESFELGQTPSGTFAALQWITGALGNPTEVDDTLASLTSRLNAVWGRSVQKLAKQVAELAMGDRYFGALALNGWARKTGSQQTVDDTPTTVETLATLAAGESVRVAVSLRADGPANADHTYVRIDVVFKHNGSAVVVVEKQKLPVKRLGAHALTDADVDISGNDIRLRVTGEAASAIDWKWEREVFR